MRVTSFLVALTVLWGLGIADASPKTDVQAKIKEAMENYDLMDYDAARKLVTQALAIAKKNKLDADPLVAKALLSLGIIQFVEKDQGGAKSSFQAAVAIDAKIQIDPAYKSAELAKLLEQARKEAAGRSGGAAPEPPDKSDKTDKMDKSGPDCLTISGLQHTVIDTATAGQPLPIEADVAIDVTATKIAVMYRPEGATEFSEAKLKKEGDCKYTGAIPGSAMRGTLVHYYVAAFNEFNKPVAAKGSAGAPNIIELKAPAPAGRVVGDKEDPINGNSGEYEDEGVASRVTVGAKRQRVMIAIAGGTGFAYLSGQTETKVPVQACTINCFGSSLLVLQPELGYFVTQKLSVGVAGRIGVPIGANLEGHATAAPGGVVRVRYALADDGSGVRFMGEIGAGIIRSTIRLENASPGMDTDIVAQGPLLLGAGVGYTKRLTPVVSVMADVSALAGIAVVKAMGPAPVLNSGIGADLSLGVQLGF